MPLIQPTRTDAGDWRYRITLEDREFRVRIRYSLRFECYYLDLFDADGVALQTGVRMVVGFPLLVYNRRAALPNGQLMACRFDVEQDRAAFGVLGEDMLLGYYTAEELTRDVDGATEALTITSVI